MCVHGCVCQPFVSARGRGRDTEPVGDNVVVALSYAFGVKIALCRQLEWGQGDHAMVHPVFEGMENWTPETADPEWEPGPEMQCIFLAQNDVHYWCLYGD